MTCVWAIDFALVVNTSHISQINKNKSKSKRLLLILFLLISILSRAITELE